MAEDPHQESPARISLFEAHTLEETAQHFEKPVDEIRARRSKMRRPSCWRNAQRVRPHLDDKVLHCLERAHDFGRFAKGARFSASRATPPPRREPPASSSIAWLTPRPAFCCGAIRNSRRLPYQVFWTITPSSRQGLLDLYETQFDLWHLDSSSEAHRKADGAVSGYQQWRVLQLDRWRRRAGHAHEGGLRRCRALRQPVALLNLCVWPR